MTSFFSTNQDYESISDPTPGNPEDDFTLNNYPTPNELLDYSKTLDADELCNAINARLIIGQRCIEIAERIIDSEKSATANAAVQSHNSSSNDQLLQSLNDSIHNAREATGEVKLMLQQLNDTIKQQYGSGNSSYSQKYQQYQKQHTSLQQAITLAHTKSQQLKVQREEQQQSSKKDVHIDIDTERSTQISGREGAKGKKSRQKKAAQKQQEPTYDAYQSNSQQADQQQPSQQFQVLKEWSPEEQAALDEELQQRTAFILEIERDVLQVHEMFRDLNNMVNIQQYMVDSIEQSIMETSDKTKLGMHELYTAEQYQRKKRAKMCCMVLAMALIILTVILTVSIILT